MKKLKQFIFKLLLPFPAGVLVALILWFIATANVLNIADKSRHFTLDLLSQSFPYEEAFGSYADRMLFIDIDDEALNKIGQWPWPRQKISEIFNAINLQNPAVVGVDILFAEKDRYASENIAGFFGIQEEEFTQLGVLDGDKLLADKMQAFPYVLAIAALDDDQEIEENQTDVTGRFVVIDEADQFLYQADTLLAPIKEFENTPGFGFVNTIKREGKIRKTPLLFSIKDEIHPSLNLEMVRVAQGTPNHVMKFNDVGDKLLIKSGEVITQTDLDGTFYFHYGDMNRFNTASILDVMENKVDLSEKILIIGSSAAGLGDYHSTSYQEDIPGPLFHLQVIDQILGQRFINFHPVYDQIIYLLTVMFSITLCWLITKYSVYLIAFALPISLAPLYYLSKYAFLGFGLIVNVPLALAILFFSGIATYIIKTFIENIEKRKIQSSFLQYVPADIVKNINKESDVPSLGGEEIEATVFFLDIRGFTSITETLKDDPNLLVKVIGHIMNRVTDILIQHEATIDKYIGDAVMAFWNAPVKVENHQAKAYQASLAIKQEIPKINAEVKAMLSQEQSKLINVNFGMGLSTGQVVVGNMGSEFRFNYSVMGDMVNVAARLEAMTKEKKKIILAGSLNFSDQMIKNLKAQGITLKFIDDIAFREKKEKIPVYAVE